MKTITWALISLFSVVTLVHAADSVPITPGLWEINSTSTNPFSGSKSHTKRECITETALDPVKMMADMPQDDCQTSTNVTGNTITYQMNCTISGQQMSGNGRFTVDGDSAKGEMTMESLISGQAFKMKTVSSGKRIGEC